MTERTNRITALDAVRGVAVLGIFAMNIVSMGLPGYAYVDPFYAGYAGPADGAAWAVNYMLFDGKMRALFTMLFGASMALIAERSANPAETHYRRMFALFLFGMIHAWLIWYGDILVQYSIAGALGFWLWRRSQRVLIGFGLAMALLQVGINLGHYRAVQTTRAAAVAPGATAAAVKAWAEMTAAEAPSANVRAEELRLYRGGVADAFAARAPMTAFFQAFLLPVTMPEVLAFMTFGILLLRSGFFSGGWSRRHLRLAVAAGYLVAVPLTGVIGAWYWSHQFDWTLAPLPDTLSLLCRPFIALAHASVVVMLIQAGRPLERLAAAGRMAFSNYLGTSIVATTLFYGYGAGLFGQLSRAQLWFVVIAMWGLILAWSQPWLARFHYGPLEWLWRSLARGKRQPFQRRDASLGPREHFTGA